MGLPMATTITSKGQVTIPKPIRDYLGIGPGSQVNFRRTTDGEHQDRKSRWTAEAEPICQGAWFRGTRHDDR